MQTHWQAEQDCVLCQAANITRERLASFDRPIKSEPAFRPEQQAGLLADLTNYLQTLTVRALLPALALQLPCRL